MLSFGHMVVVLLIVVLLFGAGKLPKVMGDIGKGIKNLRDELGDDKTKDHTVTKQEILPPEDKR